MSIRFVTPVDGQMLTDTAGVRKGDVLAVSVAINACPDAKISVNGVDAVYSDGAHRATVELDSYRVTLEATDAVSGDTERAVIYWLRDFDHRYAFSVDDNIWFLQDLHLNRDTYTSIFDNSYLAMYKELHDTFGTCVRLNIFYSTPRLGGFNLSEMTDKYRDEFRANSNWLHLAFHADKEFPEWPYSNSTFLRMQKDYADIAREIKRFAGQDALENATTIHFGSGNRPAVRGIRGRGITTLMGYMEVQDGKSFVSYYLSPEEVDKVNEYGFWKDHSEDMIFGRIDCVMNLYPVEGIRARLDEGLVRFPKRGTIELMIHEQYFYPDYQAYIPNYKERIFAGVQWCVDHGYKPCFSGDVTAQW